MGIYKKKKNKKYNLFEYASVNNLQMSENTKGEGTTYLKPYLMI